MLVFCHWEGIQMENKLIQQVLSKIYYYPADLGHFTIDNDLITVQWCDRHIYIHSVGPNYGCIKFSDFYLRKRGLYRLKRQQNKNCTHRDSNRRSPETEAQPHKSNDANYSFLMVLGPARLLWLQPANNCFWNVSVAKIKVAVCNRRCCSAKVQTVSR